MQVDYISTPHVSVLNGSNWITKDLAPDFSYEIQQISSDFNKYGNGAVIFLWKNPNNASYYLPYISLFK